MAKKIAIPTREGMIDDHFGHCVPIIQFLRSMNRIRLFTRNAWTLLKVAVASRILHLSCRKWGLP